MPTRSMRLWNGRILPCNGMGVSRMLADASTKHCRNPSSKRFGLLPRFGNCIASKIRCGILLPSIDTNLVENDIRPTVVGRKRWLFIGHPDAGWRSAVIYSLLISARRRGLNPQAYLTDILARLPSIKITHIHELLPGNWQPPSAR